jgi:hypothetical protein
VGGIPRQEQGRVTRTLRERSTRDNAQLNENPGLKPHVVAAVFAGLKPYANPHQQQR